MAAGPIVTLTTDFGASDAFAGTMKGIVYSINPSARVVDITHDVPPQDIRTGAFVFDSAYHYFPPGTVHVLVVDPAVGTNRRAIVVQSPDAYFVCPDNGLLSYAYMRGGGALPGGEPFEAASVAPPDGWKAYHLTNHQYWHHPVSSTFHGRDVFAPVAGHLTAGVSPNAMGAAIDSVAAFAIPQPQPRGNRLVGSVMYVDRFGNLITNLKAKDVFMPDAHTVIELAGKRLAGLASAYQDGPPYKGIIGSHGYLEIAAANANASQMLGVTVGDEVAVGTEGA